MANAVGFYNLSKSGTICTILVSLLWLSPLLVDSNTNSPPQYIALQKFLLTLYVPSVPSTSNFSHMFVVLIICQVLTIVLYIRRRKSAKIHTVKVQSGAKVSTAQCFSWKPITVLYSSIQMRN